MRPAPLLAAGLAATSGRRELTELQSRVASRVEMATADGMRGRLRLVARSAAARGTNGVHTFSPGVCLVCEGEFQTMLRVGVESGFRVRDSGRPCLLCFHDACRPASCLSPLHTHTELPKQSQTFAS